MFPEPRTLAMRAFPLADRGPTGRIVVTMADITQRRRLEVLRRDFVANASHELKTPVAAVRVLAETLLTALPEDPEAGRRFAERIGREAERLDVLVRDLLDLSRVERGTLDVEPVDLVGLAKEVTGGYADLAEERRVRLRTELQPLVSVRGDRAQLGLLLSNLLDNALRHTSAKGTRAGPPGRRPRAAPPSRWPTPARASRPPSSPAIFERFYRVDKARARQTGGTGLGLAIVRHVAEAHGGTVRVESELGQGSTFTVTLAGAPAPPSPVASLRVGGEQSGGQQDQDDQGDDGQGGGQEPRGGVGRDGVAGADGPVGGQEAAVAAPGGDGAEQDQHGADELAAGRPAERRGEPDHPEAGDVEGEGGPHPGQQGPLVGQGEAVVGLAPVAVHLAIRPREDTGVRRRPPAGGGGRRPARRAG